MTYTDFNRIQYTLLTSTTATTSPQKSSLISLESSAPCGTSIERKRNPRIMPANEGNRQIRQGIATNTKGTAFVVYEDVMDAKAACEKLNGFHFQNRYLVGTSNPILRYKRWKERARREIWGRWDTNISTVLYHQPEKMARPTNDLEERKENLEKLKREHGID